MRPLIVFAMLAGTTGAHVAFQSRTQPPERPQFRAGVEVVEVDVSVLDGKRRPVRGLTAADFTIVESGRQQEIVSFSAIDVPEPARTPAGWMRDVPPDVRTNLAGADRLIVLVLDDAQVRTAPQHAKAVKDMARGVIDRLGPNDLAAIVFTRDNEGAQPFTNDRQRLLAAVDAFHAEFSPDNSWYFYMSSLKTLRYVAESLYDASQRRKSVIYISPGVPLEGNDSDAFERRREAQAIIDHARRANVNVYGLDPSGLGGLDREDSVAVTSRVQTQANDLLHALASGTGGRALVNRNDFADGAAEVFAENASYYLLGYRSTSVEPAGRFRPIDVRVNRPGVTVRARSGYVAGRADEPAKNGPSPALVKAMRDAAPKGDVAMQMTAVPFAVPGKKTPAVAMAIALRQPRVTSTDRIVEQVDLLVAAYEPDGKRGPSERLSARVVLKAADDPFVRYELLTGLPMRPGRYQLRVAAQSAVHAKEGSLHYDLVVPDFSKGDLALSGVALSVEPNVPVAGRERIAFIVPVVPTSRREFWETDRVSAFLQLYRNKGNDPVTVTVRLLNAQDATFFEKVDSLPTERFGSNHAADYQVPLPVEAMPPGPYLVTIEAATSRSTSRRDVRIVRR